MDAKKEFLADVPLAASKRPLWREQWECASEADQDDLLYRYAWSSDFPPDKIP